MRTTNVSASSPSSGESSTDDSGETMPFSSLATLSSVPLSSPSALPTFRSRRRDTSTSPGATPSTRSSVASVTVVSDTSPVAFGAGDGIGDGVPGPGDPSGMSSRTTVPKPPPRTTNSSNTNSRTARRRRDSDSAVGESSATVSVEGSVSSAPSDESAIIASRPDARGVVDRTRTDRPRRARAVADPAGVVDSSYRTVHRLEHLARTPGHRQATAASAPVRSTNCRGPKRSCY